MIDATMGASLPMDTARSTPAAERLPALRAATEQFAARMIGFAQRLVQTPSLPGEEREIAELTVGELRVLGYDDVWIDRAGNAIGVLRGTGGGPSVQFNAHLDHVSPGDHALWPRPPFGGIVEDGVLYGRGASDVKGAMATQVYLVPVLKEAGLRPTGDVYVVGVVLEEVGGYGSAVLAREAPTDVAVLAEATNNGLRRGHRGRTFVQVRFTGLSVHASAPERGHNPHYAAARFLLRLESLPMVKDATFGGSSVAPTLIETDQTSGNVTPGTIDLYLDWRNVPGESAERILAKLAPLARAVEAEVAGISIGLDVVGRPVRTYTGLEAELPATRGFETPADHPVLLRAKDSLEATLGRPVEVGTWTFATDGGHLDHHGITTIGFAPGEERFAHTIHDQVDLAKMREALLGNAALALDLTEGSGVRGQGSEGRRG
jgi:putative selenium metabolism hydrolase